VINGDADILKALLTAGALVKSPCDSTNALNISVEEERLDLVEGLLESGADINNPPPPLPWQNSPAARGLERKSPACRISPQGWGRCQSRASPGRRCQRITVGRHAWLYRVCSQTY
jgi:hypothetical protein